MQESEGLQLTEKQAREYLGPEEFDPLEEERSVERGFKPGQCNILATAGFSGNVMMVECVYDPQGEQKGTLIGTGNLKTVLSESLLLAKMNAYRHLSSEKQAEIQEKNVRVHFLDAASVKDGPSAGTAQTLALLSLYMGKPLDPRLGLTGEISLSGDVCKIGGVQAKLTAAKTVGVDRVILPYANLGEV